MRRDRSAVLHFVAQVVRSLAGFGTTLLAARYFGAAGLGVYSQVLAFLFWLKFPSNSVKTAIEKRMSESETVSGHFTAGIFVTLGYGLLSGILIIIFQQYVNGYIGAEAAYLVSFLLFVNICFDLVKSGFIGRNQVAVAGWLGTAEQILRFVSQLTFVLGGAMVIGLIAGHIVSLLVFAVFGIFLLRNRLTVPSWDDFGDLRRFAQYSWLGNLQGLALTWIDILVLGAFVVDNQVGIYQASWTLASFLSLTSKSISTTLFPELSSLNSDQRYDRAQSLVGDALLFTGIFLIPGMFGAIVIGDRILEIYSSEFAAGGTILVILICSRTIYAFGSQLVNTLNGLNFPDLAFRVNGVFLITNVMGNIILVSQIGWYGAAFATLASTVVYLVLAWIYFYRKIGSIQIPVKDISYEVAASIIMALGIWIVLPYLSRSLFSTILVILTGAVIYSILIFILSMQIRGKVMIVIDT